MELKEPSTVKNVNVNIMLIYYLNINTLQDIDQFKGFPKSYTVIGGAACDILMSNTDLEFRTTKHWTY